MGSLPDSFEDFSNYETEVFDRVEDKYSEDLRQLAEVNFESQIPKSDIKEQVEWLESRFYEINPEFYKERFDNEYLNMIYSSLLPQERSELQSTVVHPSDTFESYKDFKKYDSVALDPTIIFEILNEGLRSYYLDGRKMLEWTDTINVLDEAQKRSEIYVPSDLGTKTNRKDMLGQIRPAKLFIEGFNNIDMGQNIEVPRGHEHLEEDLLIGSQAEQTGENVLILSYDPDFFSAVSEHYDVDVSDPILREE